MLRTHEHIINSNWMIGLVLLLCRGGPQPAGVQSDPVCWIAIGQGYHLFVDWR